MATLAETKRLLGGLIVGGATAFGVGFYGFYVITAPKKIKKEQFVNHDGKKTPDEGLMLPTGKRKEIFDEHAKTWDEQLWWDEFITGIKRYRRRMIKDWCMGNVLEVACGTGLNMSYYDAEKVESLALMDYSRLMIEQTKKKKREDIPTTLRVGSAEAMRYDSNTFDTVVDSFGICSFDAPRKAIREMHRVIKPGGRVVLLEHGRSTNFFYQRLLHRVQLSQLLKFGCDCNKDILGIVLSELGEHVEVEFEERKQFGTIFKIVLKKTSELPCNVERAAKDALKQAEKAEKEALKQAELDALMPAEVVDSASQS